MHTYSVGSSRIYEPSVLAEQALTFCRPHAVINEAGDTGTFSIPILDGLAAIQFKSVNLTAVPPLSDAVCDCYETTRPHLMLGLSHGKI